MSTAPSTLARTVQPSVRVGATNDPAEREADIVADRIMSASGAGSRQPAMTSEPRTATATQSATALRRACRCQGVDDIRAKPRSTVAVDQSSAPAAASDVLAGSRGTGSPLARPERAFFESRFGTGLGEVRLHTGTAAARANDSIGARAFTIGSDIFFGDGQFEPGSQHGRHLMAHELTHVIQNRPGGDAVIRRACRDDVPESATECIGLGGAAEGYRFHFVVGCDDPLGTAEQELRDFAATLGPTEQWVIHGFASEEGSTSFNDRLACRRAERAIEIIMGTNPSAPAPISVYSHGATPGDRPTMRSVVVQTVISPGPVPTPVAERVPEPAEPAPESSTEPAAEDDCNGFDDFVRWLLQIDPDWFSDLVTCGCLVGGLLDLADALPVLLPASPFIEGIDCACNVLTLVQEIYNRGADGGCFQVGNVLFDPLDFAMLVSLGGLVWVDCRSLPVGTAVGAFLFGTGGAGGGATAGAPGGPAGAAGGGLFGGVVSAAVGAAIGDFIVDVIAMGLQNVITQGTPLPVSQCQACARTANRIGVPAPVDWCGTAPGRVEWRSDDGG